MCDDKATQAHPQEVADYRQGIAGQIKSAGYPMVSRAEQLEKQAYMFKERAEVAEKAAKFLKAHPEFEEFMRLQRTGAFDY